MKNITVLFGNYGSGKTELSLNMALQLGRSGKDVALVDIDIVNPFFRSSEHKKMLEANGVTVISPVFANTAVDVPSLPPDVYAAFNHAYAVFDCGGDPVGASALGNLKSRFDAVRDRTQVLFVINTRRPFQDSAEKLAESLAHIQRNARLKADGLVLNANLGGETTGEELAEGYAVAQELEKLTEIPLVYVSGTKESLAVFARQCPACGGERFEIDIYTRPEWMT